jgi:hypothetical protein
MTNTDAPHREEQGFIDWMERAHFEEPLLPEDFEQPYDPDDYLDDDDYDQ